MHSKKGNDSGKRGTLIESMKEWHEKKTFKQCIAILLIIS
jgi:hypothetical protein